MELQKMIEELRATGLTQRDIALHTGISQSYISDLATGKRGARTSFEKHELIARLHQTRTRRTKK